MNVFYKSMPTGRGDHAVVIPGLCIQTGMEGEQAAAMAHSLNSDLATVSRDDMDAAGAVLDRARKGAA